MGDSPADGKAKNTPTTSAKSQNPFLFYNHIVSWLAIHPTIDSAFKACFRDPAVVVCAVEISLTRGTTTASGILSISTCLVMECARLGSTWHTYEIL